LVNSAKKDHQSLVVVWLITLGERVAGMLSVFVDNPPARFAGSYSPTILHLTPLVCGCQVALLANCIQRQVPIPIINRRSFTDL
jgi:hypothetical protein